MDDLPNLVDIQGRNSIILDQTRTNADQRVTIQDLHDDVLDLKTDLSNQSLVHALQIRRIQAELNELNLLGKSWTAVANLMQQEVMSASTLEQIQLSRNQEIIDRLQKYFEDCYRINEKLEPKYKPEEKLVSEPCSALVSHAMISARHGGEFAGEHANGLRHGRGIHTWANGFAVEGAWVNDALAGQATQRWASGVCFVGNFVNGLREGKGRHNFLAYASSPVNYREGHYTQGRLTNGEIVFKSGAIKTGTFEWVEKDQDYVLVDGEETAVDAAGQVGFKGAVKNRQRVSGYFKYGDGTSFEGELLEPIQGGGAQKRRGILRLPGVDVQGQFIGFAKVEGKFMAKFADGSVFDGEDGSISNNNLLSCEAGKVLQSDGKLSNARVENSVIKKKLFA